MGDPRIGSRVSNDPRVSVVVPAYNADAFVERALDSVLVQTMPELEIIVVDDASVDATSEVVCGVAARDQRVRVLRNDTNAGVSASRNRAIAEARGEWIAVLDADDAWLPGRLEALLVHEDEADVISDDLLIVRGSLLGLTEPGIWSLLLRQGLKINRPHQLTSLELVHYDLAVLKPMIRRSFLERHRLAYDPTLRYAEDLLLHFELLARGARWVQMPEGHYLYIGDSGSAVTNKYALWQGTSEAVEILLNRPSFAGDEAVTSALKLRIRQARDYMAFATFWEETRQRSFADLVRMFCRRPSDPLVVAKYVVERVGVRLAWRARHLAERRWKSYPKVTVRRTTVSGLAGGSSRSA